MIILYWIIGAPFIMVDRAFQACHLLELIESLFHAAQFGTLYHVEGKLLPPGPPST